MGCVRYYIICICLPELLVSVIILEEQAIHLLFRIACFSDNPRGTGPFSDTQVVSHHDALMYSCWAIPMQSDILARKLAYGLN